MPISSKCDRTNAQTVDNTNQATRIILVCHGRSTYNEKSRYQGMGDDAVLTETGQRDAYQTGLALKNLKLDAIYTSSLKRTQQTASEILAALSTGKNLPPLGYVTDQLKEINLSAWQGLTYQYVREHFVDEYRCWRERPHQFSVLVEDTQATNPQFPVLDLYEQAAHFWQQMLSEHRGQTVLIVGHNSTNRALISTAIGLPPEYYHYLQQSNCGISLLEFPAGEAQAKLVALNLTAHLSRSLPKLQEDKHGLRLLLWNATTEAQTQKLRQFLKQERIDFILSPDCRDSEKAAQSLLQQTQSIYWQVSENDFPKAWQQIILQRATISGKPPSLVAGIVISRATLLNKILEQEWGNRPSLSAEALRIIHYPLKNSHPILQALIPSNSL